MTHDQLKAEADEIAMEFGVTGWQSVTSARIQRLALRFATEEIESMRQTVASSSTLDMKEVCTGGPK